MVFFAASIANAVLVALPFAGSEHLQTRAVDYQRDWAVRHRQLIVV
jgi:hypothetical protein